MTAGGKGRKGRTTTTERLADGRGVIWWPPEGLWRERPGGLGVRLGLTGADGGGWICAGLYVESTGTLRPQDLRRLPLGALTDRVLTEMLASLDFVEHDPELRAGYAEVLPSVAAVTRMSLGREYGPEHWIEVLNTYRGAARFPNGNPTKAVSERFNVSRSTAATWVNRLRYEFKVLPATTQGRLRAAPKRRSAARARSRAAGKEKR